MYAFKALATVAAIGFASVANAEYLNECDLISVNGEWFGPLLWADCLDSTGTSQLNYFDLDNCLLNNDGVLAWVQNGGFASSCTDYTLAADNITFSANCAGPEASILYTEINLNDGISVNSAGQFCCFC